MTKTYPETSIIIRTFNEEKYLPHLLTAIYQQRYKDFEIIVVDSGSYDRTIQIVLDYKVRLIQINSEDFTFGYSLNVGIKHSSGQFIVIVSAHTNPLHENWLHNLILPLRGENVAMTYGRQLGNKLSKYSEVQDFKKTFGTKRKILSRESFFANNANSAIRKDLWKEHQFNEALPGLEDLEWAQYWTKRNYKVVYEPKAAIYHIHNETWKQVYKRFYREAVAAHVIGITKIVHIPYELVKESYLLLKDIKNAILEQLFTKKITEIVIFRIFKCVAIIMGIIKGNISMKNAKKREELYFSHTSKAVIIQGAKKACFEEVETPEPSPSEVLIKIAYDGVCGTDLEIYEGRLGYYKNGKAKYPIIPGHEFSGWITKLGANVKNLKEGDPVVVECIQSCGKCEHCLNSNWIACKQRKEVGVMKLNGGYAEYIVTAARFVHKIPPNVDMKSAALCEPLAVSIKGIEKLEMFVDNVNGKNNGKHVVIGAGPIGHFCAKLLALKGKKVVVYDKHLKRLSYFDNPQIELERDITKLYRHSIFIEATGDPNVLEVLLDRSSAGATFLLLGLPYSRKEFNFENIVAYDKTVIGSVGSSSEDFDAALKILPELNVDPFLENIIPLSEFKRAWDSFTNREHLKTILEVNGSIKN